MKQSGGADARLLESLIWYGHCNRIAVRPLNHRGSMVVWNSWDWFSGHITQADMIDMTRIIRDDPLLSRHVNVVALDAGWEHEGNHGVVNEATFPDLAGMAREITNAGFVAGIWYAPFRIAPSAAWIKDNPETVLWGEPRPVYDIPLTPAANRRVLDYTHPKVLRKIHDDLTLGDHPQRLNATGRAMIGTVLAFRDGSTQGIPLDLEERNLPSKWMRRLGSGVLLAFFNAGDEPLECRLTPYDREHIGEVKQCRDVWTGVEKAFSPHSFGDVLAPHTSRLYLLS